MDLLKQFTESKKCNFESKTVKMISEEWLSTVRYNLKPSTYNKYMYLSNYHIIPCLGELYMNEINNKIIEDFIHQKLELEKSSQNKHLSSKTVKDILSVLKQIIRFAEKSGIFVQCSNEIFSIRCKTKEPRVLLKNEQDILIKFLINNLDCYNIGILLSFFTGIRIGELCALQWNDIDFEAKTIRICKTMLRIQLFDLSKEKTGIIVSEPKSPSSNRIIPIPDFMFELLLKHKSTNDDYYVLSGCKKYVEPRVIQYRFKKITNELNIKNATMHTLRHTFATRCIEVGVDVKSLSEILGHSSVDITLNRYVHSSIEQKRKCMELFANYELIKIYQSSLLCEKFITELARQ